MRLNSCFRFDNLVYVQRQWMQDCPHCTPVSRVTFFFTCSDQAGRYNGSVSHSAANSCRNNTNFDGRVTPEKGMRLTECVRLRVKDLDFEYRQIAVRSPLDE